MGVARPSIATPPTAHAAPCSRGGAAQRLLMDSGVPIPPLQHPPQHRSNARSSPSIACATPCAAMACRHGLAQHRAFLKRPQHVACQSRFLSIHTFTPASMAVPTSVGAAVEAASARYPLAKGFRPSYGTAGFRALAELLDSTMFRCVAGAAPKIAWPVARPDSSRPFQRFQLRHYDGRARHQGLRDHRHLHHRLAQPSARQRRQAGGAERGDAVPGVGGGCWDVAWRGAEVGQGEAGVGLQLRRCATRRGQPECPLLPPVACSIV